MLCERCGTNNPEGCIVCVRCYYAVGIPYGGGGKAQRKESSKMPSWATAMGLDEDEIAQVASQLAGAKGEVMAYWFASGEDAAEAQKGLADTIGKEIKSKKVRIAVADVQGRSALFIAGKVSDIETLQMVCSSFNGEPAVGVPAAAEK